ncbi:MAG: YebC/PmpR family DNA-binding transcriptional regulator [Lentisphaeria bacterium]|nr:YebC/PmpR family DNA-binding transcriptional regulator [Lentisphaeria bacterium]
MGRTFENRKHAMMKRSGSVSKLYSKYSKEVYVCAKNSGWDVDGNPALRRIIDKAKKDSVPTSVIETAIKKVRDGAGEDYQPARYEGYGPGNVMVIVDCLTDNNNRTIADVRNCFTKTDSKLGTQGSVSRMFDHQAIFSFTGDDDEEVLEALMMADVDVADVNVENGMVTVFAPHTEFFKAKTALTESFPDIKFEVEEITFEPQMMAQIHDEDIKKFEKLLTMLNDCDDVQDVYHNAEYDVEE